MRDKTKYFYGDNIQDAKRLALLSELHDDCSMRWLLRLGLSSSQNFLEIGAGNGSLALRIARQGDVRRTIMVTDLDIGLIEDFEKKYGIAVRQHDIVEDGPIEGQFDFVHARMVVSHLNDPVRGLRNMINSLKLGGIIAVEDLDKTSSSIIEESGSFEKDRILISEFVASSGYNPFMGRLLPGMLSKLGLIDIFAEGSIRFAFGGSGAPEWATYIATLESMQEREDKRFSNDLLRRVRAATESPDLITMGSTMVIAAGRLI